MNDEDNDLTNLSWLHNVNVSGVLASSSSIPSVTASKRTSSSLPRSQSVRVSKKKSKAINSTVEKKSETCSTQDLQEQHLKLLKKGNYKEDSNAKPPFSYAALICLAMKSSGESKKLTLNQIYGWIRENFAFYRRGDPSWQVCTPKTFSLSRLDVYLDSQFNLFLTSAGIKRALY